MSIRLRWWRLRGSREPLGGCPACGSRLQVCAGCSGDWRRSRCGRCRLGTCCPVHGGHLGLL
jgi:hypothetical protein